MFKTLEDLKKSNSYRYLKELVLQFDNDGIEDEPMEIPIRAMFQAPLPDYLPVSQAIRLKIQFLLALHEAQGHLPGLIFGLPGTRIMLHHIAEDLEKE